MKTIKLTQGLFAQVDDTDFLWLSQWKWHAMRCKNVSYAARKEKKEKIDLIHPRIIFLHRFIMNAPKGMEVDHRDRNGLNNQRYNLRICSHAQNQMNRKSVGSSKYLGVCWAVNQRKWKAGIKIDKKYIYIGYYNTEKEAAIAYNLIASKYHGEFARLNIIN